MLEDCQSHKLDIILTKSIGRFGRDSVDTLDALNQLKMIDVRVIFEQESLDTADTDSDLMISIIEAIAQAENESRSENIRWGIRQRAANGSSKLYNRKCYGYVHDKEGNLIIDDKEAKYVRMIFDQYLHGKSIIDIVRLLNSGKLEAYYLSEIITQQSYQQKHSKQSNSKSHAEVMLQKVRIAIRGRQQNTVQRTRTQNSLITNNGSRRQR